MDKFKTFLKSIKTVFNVLIVTNKNKEKCILVLGLEANSVAQLPSKLQELISKSRDVEGLNASYTPPHKSTSGEGLIYFGPQADISDDDIDAFEV